MTTSRSRTRRLGLFLVAAAVVGPLAVPAPVEAQYFGRNKVQYDDFEWQVLATPHFDIHYYDEMSGAIEDLARQTERWYERLARTFQHEFEESKPLIFYADHPDFQQTNTLGGFIGEGTGGVTESLKNRVIMPMTGSYWDTDHVLGHELVHAFQYNVAQSRQGGGLQGLVALPLWLIEGMAEYLSVGREDPLTAMWLRDAVMRDDFPTIRQMTREQRFFPYRFGQALWAYVGGVYGDDAIIQTFRRSLRIGFPPAIQQVLGVSTDTLSSQWKQAVVDAYTPLLEGRTPPDSVGERILDDQNAGNQNVAPSLSPDGQYIAFLSEKDLFSVDLYMADARTGEVIRKLSSANSDPHADALRFIDSSGTWSPDGSRLAYVVFSGGDNEINIVGTDNGKLQTRIKPEGIGAITSPAWSPDGRYIAFTGMKGGIADLYLWDLEAGEYEQLTNDRFADFHATWSPDGRTIAFASDRGPETDFETFSYSKFRIALFDIETRGLRVLPLLGNVRHTNPQFGPDGALYFLSDADGFSDIYRTDAQGRSVERITRVATGVSGIVSLSPALSVSAETGEIAFSVFEEFGFRIHRLPPNTPGMPLTRVAETDLEVERRGRNLPPVASERFSRVAEYLEDPETGLEPEGMYAQNTAADYDPSLALDFLGQPSIGVGADQFGTYLGGGASAFFSDMLGNQVLAVAVQAQGTVKDIGGQVQYADLGDRWNWGVSAGRIPYQLLFQTFNFGDSLSAPSVSQIRQRVFETSVGGQLAYPFSTTRRLEGGLGFRRYSYDFEEDRFFLDQFGRIFAVERLDRPDLEAQFSTLNLGSASLAYVGDNSFFGFTSPIRGGRFRFGVDATVGTENFFTAIADWRRYWAPHQNLTVGFRGMHIGRYGGIESANVIQPYFLGWETNIRGYAYESFETTECRLPEGSTGDGCPVFDRLFGNQIVVANFEMRIPF
ncbi:MAG: PD40 domain-containing protein, partial [Gemmatimonadetes bacterium]|nr:PD40 domain-containing protein [Gemmatimonadota bacterium]